ncbi:unnamed protein product, partial [Callosobruchus maculatus]
SYSTWSPFQEDLVKWIRPGTSKTTHRPRAPAWIEQDMENYLEYKLSKVKARMKDDVVPHIFACELDGVAAKASGHMARKGEFSELLCNQDADSEWQPNNDSSSEDIFSPSVAPENQKDKESKFQSAFVRKIEKSLRFCTGIPKEQMDFIANLVTKTSLETYLICLTFYKIKTNYAFERIAIDLGISGSHATALFVRSTLVLSEFMKQLVYWPSSKSMRKLLLEGFGTSFHNVQSIIDCLEIKIQKPSAAVHQSSTWSEYKQCNTIKYLISYTPDGFINFLSSGYGGSASDVAVLQDCGYLRVLPENCTVTVMIDRDFKQIENLLYTKKCTLVRFPSFANNSRIIYSTKRIVDRIQEFKILGPLSTIPSALIQILDNIVMISCAVINSQRRQNVSIVL